MPDIILIIKTFGLLGIFLMVFAESGLFFGFFLPGDSLLFSAGLIASGGFFDIRILIAMCIVAAIVGDSVGYFMGKHMGPKLFYRDTGFFFKKKRITEAEDFYSKYGEYTIVIARFVPIIRTFAPIVAGIGKMRYKTFAFYNIIGGTLWVASVISLGYFLGRIIPNPDTYILPIVFIIVFISVLPIMYKYIIEMNKKRR